MKTFILLTVLAILAGCATQPRPRGPNGVLVETWYEGVNGSPAPRHRWEPRAKMCRYENDVVVNIGLSTDCPK